MRTYRRWRVSGKPPVGAVRLLAILAGFVPWDGWDGWEVHQGFLFPPGYRRGGVLPAEFFALVFHRQLVTEQRAVIERLRARVAELEAQEVEARTASPSGRRRVPRRRRG